MWDDTPQFEAFSVAEAIVQKHPYLASLRHHGSMLCSPPCSSSRAVRQGNKYRTDACRLVPSIWLAHAFLCLCMSGDCKMLEQEIIAG